MADPVWTHRDNSLAASCAQARVVARAGAWSTPDAPRLFRAILAETAGAISWFSGRQQVVVNESGTVAVLTLTGASAPRERLAVSGRLYSTLEVLRRGAPPPQSFATGDAPEVSGLLPAVGIVLVSIVGAVALAYCAHETAAVIDRQLSRQEGTRKLMAQHVAALEAVEAHQKREQAAGKALPLDAATERVLDALESEQRQVLAQREEPFGSFLPDFGSKSGLMGSAWALVAAFAAGWIVK